MKCLRQRSPRVYQLSPSKYPIDVRGKRFEAIRLTLTNGRRRMDFSKRQEALAEAGKIERALLSHGTERLNDIGQFVSNGELTVLANALAIHGKTLADAGRFYLDPLSTENEKRQSRPISELSCATCGGGRPCWPRFFFLARPLKPDRHSRKFRGIWSAPCATF